MGRNDLELMGHLMRRAGFGAGLAELEARAARGYDATVDELVAADSQDGIDDDLLYRYHPDHQGGLGLSGAASYWLYRMVNTRGTLQEKMTLFWHSVFATGYPKVTQGKILMNQLAMFRKHGLGSFRDLLVELSRDPAMIMWLDNEDNHAGAINENYGRELLELFSMGVGNYTEKDVKETARAFTGWTVANTEYMTMRAERDSLWPYGRLAYWFEYRPEDHDDGEKDLLGHHGRFGGEDAVDIICSQPATARFIARHLYHFFVADESPVPQWPYEAPRDREAIDFLTEVYFKHDYNVGEMVRALLKSDFFRSEESRYRKVKGPAELIAGVLRLTGECNGPSLAIQENTNPMSFMGQTLINPPSVEGWHQGTEWVDTGTAVERVNYAAERLGNADAPGVRDMIVRVSGSDGGPEGLVQRCLDEMGAISVSDDTRAALVQYAQASDIDMQSGEGVGELMEMVAATPDFQRE